jgi:ABC-type nitrate/sulfonate/bicarbonate transport system permease component
MARLISVSWLFILTLAVWQAAAFAGALNPLFVPTPAVLFSSAATMIRSGELVANAAATLGRAVAGFTIGSMAGISAGLAMGSIRAVRQSLEPVVSALNATPKLSLFPLLMLVFGIGETARLSIIALSSFVITAIHALDAVRNIHPAWVDLARNYGARRRDLFGAVYLPACLPQVFTGMRLGLANALVLAISCELVNPSSGLGSLIWLAWQTFSTERLYVTILATALLGTGLHAGLRMCERRLVPWKTPHGG